MQYHSPSKMLQMPSTQHETSHTYITLCVNLYNMRYTGDTPALRFIVTSFIYNKGIILLLKSCIKVTHEDPVQVWVHFAGYKT